MISQKSYLINALYQWCEDNEFTPYLIVAVDENTIVPITYVKNNQIVLNIASASTKDILINKKRITFKTTFNGVIHDINIPIGNVLAIFAKENGQGMEFKLEPTINQTTSNSGGLKLVK
jgi:stringent starvation protein B